MLIGYVRVSKSDGSQTLAPQRDAMLSAGVEPDRIYQDLASGRHDARPGLSACLKALQPGNTLVLWKLDRLGRDLKHLIMTAEDLRVRGIGLKVLTGAGAQIDTTTANGRLAFGITMRIQRPSTRSAFTALNDCEPPELLGSIKQQLRDRSDAILLCACP
jgi:DNA invertase Pin-like site-specific DNA recombinase